MEEEALHSHSENTWLDYRSNVDTSRPFSSVKEAVAIFGERLLVGEIYSPKPYVKETSWKFSPPSPILMKPRDQDNEDAVFDTLKKLEAELEETKVEVKLLMERESETEVALASLNAELHKNMSKLAEAEAALAAREGGVREEERLKRELMMIRTEGSPTLAQIFSSGDKAKDGRQYERKMMKKKPIIPLVGDLFSRKKRSPTTLHNLLNSSPHHLYD